jgi:Ser/Thr protein kinase RdoA (MazF antagonist)
VRASRSGRCRTESLTSLGGADRGRRSYGSLSRRGQIGRLRRLGRSALAGYGLKGARLSPLRHEHNTTFRLEARGGPYVLRINRPGVHTPETIGSEMAWLRALRRDTGLGVPDPVAAGDGSLVVLACDPGVPEPRACVLLRWLHGRFVDERLTPGHLRRVARLQAALHEHARRWTPPKRFVRPRVDALTTPAKVDGIAPTAEATRPADHPSQEDADRGLELITELGSAEHAGVFATALDLVWATTRELAAQPGNVGLIHGDLHQENYLFKGSDAHAIDFDDCGWGFFLHDLAVTLSELEGRPRYGELRAALLDEYTGLRQLPEHAETHLEAFAILRRMNLLMWVVESRHHPAFRADWQAWTREQLRELAAALDAAR